MIQIYRHFVKIQALDLGIKYFRNIIGKGKLSSRFKIEAEKKVCPLDLTAWFWSLRRGFVEIKKMETLTERGGASLITHHLASPTH